MHLLLAALLAFEPAGPPAAAAVPDTYPVLEDVELGFRLVVDGLMAPTRWGVGEWLRVPAAAVVLGAVSAVDDDVERLAETNQGSAGDLYFGAVEPLGDAYSIALVIGIYGGGLVLNRPGWRRTAVEAAAATVVASGVVTPSLKVILGRVRPRDGQGPYRFRPFSGHRSFPSGHTTQAFAVASVLAAESESVAVDVLAYAVAASVAGARIYHDAHFLTDVLAGAAIGTLVGRGMVRAGRDLPASVPFVGTGSDGGLAVGFRVKVGSPVSPTAAGASSTSVRLPRRSR